VERLVIFPNLSARAGPLSRPGGL